MRSLWRALRVLEHLITGALISVYVWLMTLLGLGPSWVPAVVRWWHARLCRALGVRIRVSGRIAAPCLLAANHISWLDIPVLGSQAEIGFLSKAEVRHWPLVGWMAAVAGTLFIERGANQVGAIVQRIATDIQSGRTITIFPEGTTSDGRSVGRFHPRLFAIAQHPGLVLQPVALAYRHGDLPLPDTQVPFVGEDTLVANLLRVIRHPDLVAELSFLEPIESASGEDRRTLSKRTHQMIADALGLAGSEMGSPVPAMPVKRPWPQTPAGDEARSPWGTEGTQRASGSAGA